MFLLTRRGLGALAFAAATPFLFPLPVDGQYFGRQKVQYETFDWRVLQTERFQVHHYAETEEVSRDAARMAERWYARLSSAFQHEFDQKPLIFYADHPDFQQTNVIGGMISQATGGVTEALRNRVIMPYTGLNHENDHVLGHELVHVFQYDIAQGPAGGGLAGLSRLPLWLIEGMAEYLSLGREDAHTAMWLRDAAIRGELPTIVQLGRDPRFFPYRYGQALWAYVAGRWGDRAVTEIYRMATRTGFEPALTRVIGISADQLSQDWITATRSTYLPLIEGRQRTRDAGDPVIVDEGIGAMNLAPVVSPNGDFVAFFGRRDVFTVDLYIADSRTGEIVRRLTSPNRNAHFDAISFMNSAGAWSPDGRQFAFIVFREGDNEISILDATTARTRRSIGVEGVGAISHLSWSPDGRTIAFSGMAGGRSNLYVLDVESATVRQLTNDRYAALMPAFSPDGRTLAFVTDEPGTDFDQLVFGNLVLALMDLETRQIRFIEAFAGVKHINPQFSPDGADLFFISDPEGFSDIYRLTLADNTLYQVTRLATGVSGITGTTPAISVASQTGRLLFSAFENGGNNIYGLEQERTRGTLVTDRTVGARTAALLPPTAAAGTGLVHAYLEDAVTGLPPTGDFPLEPYRTSIALEYLGPPSFGIGVSDFGTGLAGGVSAFFGDMLGNHLLGTAVQASGTLRDIGAQAIYINAARRWNWGAALGRIPLLGGQVFVGPGPPGSGTTQVDQLVQRVFIDQAQLQAMYPFATTSRFEITGGVTRYSFHRELYTALFQGGRQVSQIERREIDAPDPITFAETSVAMVGDNSFFGFTSPLVGQRYRFQATPTFGTFQFQTLLADYRRYVFLRPFTFAVRGLHFGRYGRDHLGIGDDGTLVLNPIFLGNPYLVRGYSGIQRNPEECRPEDDNTACPVFERLFGSRVGVASIELRLPLIGTEELGLINFPFLPTEIAPFFDVGAAWRSPFDPDDELELRFERQTSARVPVFSTGLSARFNILGYLVLEAFYAYPFQRPDRGWHWGFQVQPGW